MCARRVARSDNDGRVGRQNNYDHLAIAAWECLSDFDPARRSGKASGSISLNTAGPPDRHDPGAREAAGLHDLHDLEA